MAWCIIGQPTPLNSEHNGQIIEVCCSPFSFMFYFRPRLFRGIGIWQRAVVFFLKLTKGCLYALIRLAKILGNWNLENLWDNFSPPVLFTVPVHVQCVQCTHCTCCLIYSEFQRNFHFFIHSNGLAYQPSLGLYSGKCIETNISWLRLFAKIIQKRQHVKTG